MRRLPIFLVLDVSESMAGEPLSRLQTAMESIVSSLRQDPGALETVHVSVIAFAGKAQVLVPLIELMAFYPPRLPMGGGTALGQAMDELMTCLNVNVKRTTAEQKGDWKPVVYLLTDGRPTDNVLPAIARWKETYASRAHLIAVTLGDDADLEVLSQLTPDIVALDDKDPDGLARFAKWVSASVSAQSQALDMGDNPVRISLAKAEQAGLSLAKKPVEPRHQYRNMDERVVVMTGRCHRNRQPYLIKYESAPMPAGYGSTGEHGIYGLSGCFPITEEYFDWSSQADTSLSVSTSQLEGTPGCPHCGAGTAIAMCSCGKLMCNNGANEQECPWCHQHIYFQSGGGGSFDIQRGQG